MARLPVYLRALTTLADLGTRTCSSEELGEGFAEVDVDAHADLLAAYGDEVPVTFVDGRQHDFWRVDPQRLRSALATGARD